MKYDPLTRLLHLCVAAGVTLQLLTSLVMVTPKPGRLANGWFEIHENVGIGVLVAVAIYWMWVVARAARRADGGMLFPWFSRRRMADLRDDALGTLRDVARFKLPPDDEPRPLPAAVQGLGLLLVLFMAGTGTILAIGMAPDGAKSAPIHAVAELHETAAPLMWAYLVGHPLLGFLHQLAGHGSLSRMFGFRAAGTVSRRGPFV